MSPRTEHPFLLTVEGAIPSALSGRYLRIGPNPIGTYLKGITTMTLPRQQFAVTGMTCSHCERAVTAEVSRLEGVVSVAVDVSAGNVTIECSRWLDHSEVAAAIDEAGYEMAA